ncbi:ATP-binding protein [Candidatus Neomarinimicrobiota bacterium]
MEDLSLHILDIVENSIRAGAKEVEILIRENLAADLLEIVIQDDGAGMDAAIRERALNPFFTTKSVRKVGLGLSLFRESARQAGGDLVVASGPEQGTRIEASFQHSHIDRKPLGDIARTLQTLMIGNPDIHYQYIHRKNGEEQRFDSAEANPDPGDTTAASGNDSSSNGEHSSAFNTVKEKA